MTKILNHINTYQSEAEYQNDTEKNFPNVSYIEEDDIVLFEREIGYEEQYFTIESLEDDNDVMFKLSFESSAKTISVSTDDGETWTDYTSTEDGTTIATLNMGEKVLIKGNNSAYCSDDGWSSSYSYFTASKQIDVYGNIMSLIYGDNFKEQYSFPSGTANNFSRIFYNSTVVSAEKLILPATTLADNCYYQMFYGCKGLTSAPVLPATTLANKCYHSMFQGCTGLVNAPELPATTLVKDCYYSMFQGCTGLVNAPELPATTLADNCYYQMFYGCKGLTSAPVLPATTLAMDCYCKMFSQTNVLPDCSNIDFTSEAVVASNGLIGLFAGTKVTDSDLDRLLPKNANGKYYLPVTTLNQSCYRFMFQGCSSLTTAPELPATTLQQYCYANMFNGCTSLTTAPELPATTLAQSCYHSMFNGCTSLTTAPVLPARTLVSNCYSYMFSVCTKLKYIKAMFTTTPSKTYTDNWVQNVAASGTFVKYTSASWSVTGVNGVPKGWTIQKASS